MSLRNNQQQQQTNDSTSCALTKNVTRIAILVMVGITCCCVIGIEMLNARRVLGTVDCGGTKPVYKLHVGWGEEDGEGGRNDIIVKIPTTQKTATRTVAEFEESLEEKEGLVEKKTSPSFRIERDSTNDSFNDIKQGQQQDHDDDDYFEGEPIIGRWRHRFGKSTDGGGGYIFFKHLRKAAGTSMREYLYKVYKYHSLNDGTQQQKSKINYYEQEFCAMDRNCPTIDKRWNTTLSIVVLRHPIERQMSEFFYSGPPHSNKENKNDFTNMIKDGSSTDENITATFRQEVQNWIDSGLSKNPSIGRHFSDNFQTRVLSGMTDVPPTEPSPDGVQENCLFKKLTVDDSGNIKSEKTGLIKIENSQCIGGYDAPCLYGSGGTYNKPSCFGGGIMSAKPVNITQEHQQAAMKILEGFDVVLVTEIMNDSEISNYLSDITGLPLNAMPSKNTGTSSKLSSKLNQTSTNDDDERTTKLFGNVSPKTHLYRNFLKANTPDLYDLLEYHSRYEIGLYEHAVKLFKRRLAQWRIEKDMERLYMLGIRK